MMQYECTENESLVPVRRVSDSLVEYYRGWPYFREQPLLWAPAIEVQENAAEFRVYAELPGVDQKDLKTEWKDGFLVISGEKKSSREEQDEMCQCSERSFGRFERVVDLGDSIDAEKVSAKLQNGVLEVVLPKREEAKPRSIQVVST